MTTKLVKIGVSPQRADSERRLRRVRQLLDQRDAARARLDAATEQQIRDVWSSDDASDAEPSPAAERA